MDAALNIYRDFEGTLGSMHTFINKSAGLVEELRTIGRKVHSLIRSSGITPPPNCESISFRSWATKTDKTGEEVVQKYHLVHRCGLISVGWNTGQDYIGWGVDVWVIDRMDRKIIDITNGDEIRH